MDWYGRMEMKGSQYERVSMSIPEGERRKEEWMIESDATAQVRTRLFVYFYFVD